MPTIPNRKRFGTRPSWSWSLNETPTLVSGPNFCSSRLSVPKNFLTTNQLPLWLLSWGCQRCPSIGFSIVRPLPVPFGPKTNRSLRCRAATLCIRSALAVPPGFSGFLRTSPCRFIAPCNRSWGSPCFRIPVSLAAVPTTQTRRSISSVTARTFLSKEHHLPGIDHPVSEDTADRTTLPVPARPKTYLHPARASGFPSSKGSDSRPCDLRVRNPSPMAFHPSKLFPQHQPHLVTPVSRVHQRPLPSRRFPARHLPVHLPPKR